MSAAPTGRPAVPRIAVIGAGVAGLTAAHLLDRSADVTVFESEGYAGGHTNTVTIASGPDAGLAVDTGFIVMNEQNYPLFTRLLAELGVATQPSDMTFGYHDERTGLQYAGTGLGGLFARRRQMLDMSFLRLLADIARFNAATLRALNEGRLAGLTVGAHVASLRLSPQLSEQYLYPMAAAIWSAPLAGAAEFPAEAFARFFANHGLLTLHDAPPWRTVAGGSQTYVRALLARFRGTLRVSAPVAQVRRLPEGVSVTVEGERAHVFDRAIFATHADLTLRMLADASADERRLLGAWRYSRNHTVLHSDVKVLPPRRAAWASWNYTRESGSTGRDPVSVTYHMNRLQRLQAHEQYCVTLNRRTPVDPRKVIAEFTYLHPQFDFPAMDSQKDLPRLQGQRHTWFCGSYFGFGFHEDAVRSAHDAVRHMQVHSHAPVSEPTPQTEPAGHA